MCMSAGEHHKTVVRRHSPQEQVVGLLQQLQLLCSQQGSTAGQQLCIGRPVTVTELSPRNLYIHCKQQQPAATGSPVVVSLTAIHGSTWRVITHMRISQHMHACILSSFSSSDVTQCLIRDDQSCHMALARKNGPLERTAADTSEQYQGAVRLQHGCQRCSA
jgi:hypothetical protein